MYRKGMLLIIAIVIAAMVYSPAAMAQAQPHFPADKINVDKVDADTEVRSAEIIATEGITLGDIRRTNWPTGGGAKYWAQSLPGRKSNGTRYYTLDYSNAGFTSEPLIIVVPRYKGPEVGYSWSVVSRGLNSARIKVRKRGHEGETLAMRAFAIGN